MSPTTSVMLTGVIIVVGTWSQDKKVTPRIIVGLIVLALLLSLLNESQPQLAKQLALLVLLTAIFGQRTMVPTIMAKLGYR